MTEKKSAGDIISQVAAKAGITKKLASELIRAIPEIIEEGLVRDGEAKVRGLGTFRLKRVAEKKGRNPKTGEEVIIPPHEKLVFLPEEAFKEQLNEEYRFMGMKVLEGEPVASRESLVVSQETGEVRSSQFAVHKEETEPVATTEEEATALNDTSQQSEVSHQEPGTSGTSGTDDMEPETQNPELRTQNSKLKTGAKRRNYWIIPVVILIVAALSVVFYWRNFMPSRQSAVGSQRSEQVQEQPAVDSQQSAVDSQQSEQVQEQSAVASQQSAVNNESTGTPETIGTPGTTGTRNPEPGTRNPEQNKQVPALKPQNLNLKTDLPTTKIETHLFQMAREAYGNPFLWVLIYRANRDKIMDPDLAVSGEDIVIPSLEGTARKLTLNDSLDVSDGYRLVYEFYRDKGDPRAEEFRLVMLKYQPK